MAIINLRRYCPYYPRGKFLEAPDAVAYALEEGRRVEHRQDNRWSYLAAAIVQFSPIHARYVLKKKFKGA